MEDEIKLIQRKANKIPTYNKDINQHIETCRISLSIIDQKESTIIHVKTMLLRVETTTCKVDFQIPGAAAACKPDILTRLQKHINNQYCL